MRYMRNWLPIGLAVCLASSATASVAQTAVQPDAGAQQSVADRAAELESQLIDLQVRIATMRSLASNAEPAVTRTAPQAALQGPVAPAPGQQVAALEAEVRALSAQAQKLSGRPTLILPQATIARRPAPDQRSPAGSFAAQTPQPGAAPSALPGAAPGGWAGSTTVLPSTGIAPGTLPGQFQTQPDQGAPPAGARAPRQFAERSGELPPGPQNGLQGELLPGKVYPGYENVERPPQGSAGATGWGQPAGPAAPARVARQVPAGDAETEYQTAYGYLLQQDYGAAQTAFTAFLKRHPNAPLAGNAQYWLGETHYVRGAYKNAAVAFLKGYEKYGDGNKGPDSLLKLALSLGKLRQKAAACSSLGQLQSRYRSAPQSVLTRAKNEMRRLRCPA